MSLTLTREREAKLERKAARLGKPVEVVSNELLEEQEAQAPAARQLLALPKAERARILRAQAELAAEYEADLALPAAERELTAFTAPGRRDFQSSRALKKIEDRRAFSSSIRRRCSGPRK